ncbi:TMEM165/GDT1 family protein [Phycicoccus sp. HDW14]|uniref:TMEM165/GDT1 family protein n=1 Tax=Phycicoccus sp. HDW14 TaxID=2714941 RepID=UPI001F0D9558|nr:TMEM165/GDT1 family protein [Phycicoccus sp. HDW14]
MYAFLLSTAVIFVAELGDKSQLMAMTFATRYRVRDVLIGITVATAVVHLVSVGIGAAVGTAFEQYQGPSRSSRAGLPRLRRLDPAR